MGFDSFPWRFSSIYLTIIPKICDICWQNQPRTKKKSAFLPNKFLSILIKHKLNIAKNTQTINWQNIQFNIHNFIKNYRIHQIHKKNAKIIFAARILAQLKASKNFQKKFYGVFGVADHKSDIVFEKFSTLGSIGCEFFFKKF